jgi:hypothetical protein
MTMSYDWIRTCRWTRRPKRSTTRISTAVQSMTKYVTAGRHTVSEAKGREEGTRVQSNGGGCKAISSQMYRFSPSLDGEFSAKGHGEAGNGISRCSRCVNDEADLTSLQECRLL